MRLLTVSELDLSHWHFQPPSTASMSHIYSRAAKEKWAANSLKPPRRPPVVIPSSDNTKLIEENKLTLIGRVTNPTVQKTRALVDFFTKHWSTVGVITGRDLGPHLFQFRSETEQSPIYFSKSSLPLQKVDDYSSKKGSYCFR